MHCDSRSAWHHLRKRNISRWDSRSPCWHPAPRGAGRGCASPDYPDEQTHNPASKAHLLIFPLAKGATQVRSHRLIIASFSNVIRIRRRHRNLHRQSRRGRGRMIYIHRYNISVSTGRGLFVDFLNWCGVSWRSQSSTRGLDAGSVQGTSDPA